MKKLIYLYIIAIFFTSCNFTGNVTYENEVTEKENAVSVVAMFYLDISRGEYEKASSLFSDSFFEITSKEKLNEILENTKEVLGEHQDYNLQEWKTHRVEGTNPKTEYLLVYKVKYSKFEATETFSMIKVGEEIKIHGYNVNSEGFRDLSN